MAKKESKPAFFVLSFCRPIMKQHLTTSRVHKKADGKKNSPLQLDFMGRT